MGLAGKPVRMPKLWVGFFAWLLGRGLTGLNGA